LGVMEAFHREQFPLNSVVGLISYETAGGDVGGSTPPQP
jgi:hypothetical protein